MGRTIVTVKEDISLCLSYFLPSYIDSFVHSLGHFVLLCSSSAAFPSFVLFSRLALLTVISDIITNQAASREEGTIRRSIKG